MKANYNHKNRMNRSNVTSQQVRRTIRINRNRMELKPDEPPDIRRVLAYLNPQAHSGTETEPETPMMTVSQLYMSKLEPTSGTFAITNQDDMDALLQYSKSGRNTKGVTFTILDPATTYTANGVYFPVALKSDSDTNSPIPISTDAGFEGTLDGKGATITLAIGETAAARSDDGTTLASVGLFGVIGVNGMVKNLTLAGKVSAGADAGAVGALAGYNSGIIDNVINTATVYAPKCYNVGGIAGFNDGCYLNGSHGTIRNCQNKGDVTGYEKVGGITGENSGLIGACANIDEHWTFEGSTEPVDEEEEIYGMIQAMSDRRCGAGGIAGRNGNNNTAVESGTIEDCYNTGAIYGGVKGDRAQWVGGIAGFQNQKSKCSCCYNVGHILGYSYVHNIIGENDHLDEDEKPIGVDYCYGLKGAVETTSDREQTSEDMKTVLEIEEMQGEQPIEGDYYLVYFLNKNGTYWERQAGKNNQCPILLENTYKCDASPASGKVENTTVYLDEFDGPTIGETDKPSDEVLYHNLAEAAQKAGAGGTVVLMNPITINQATSLYDNVIYKRGFEQDEAMFTIDIPNVTENDKPALGYLTMTTATIDGGGTGTLFNVKHGRLRLRGAITLKNCETAVSVNGQGPAADLLNAQVEVNYATIDATFRDANDEVTATNTAIKLANANSDFILDAFNAVSISGTIYLGAGAYITVGATIPCELTVVCETPARNVKIAQGTDKYPVTDADAKMLSVAGWVSTRRGNQIVLTQ